MTSSGRATAASTNSTRMQEFSPGYRFDPNRLLQATWTSTQTSRLLLEAGGTVAISQWNQFFMPGVTPDMVRITDLGTGISYGSGSVYRGDPNNTDRYSVRGSVSYVTGSHNFKAGFLYEHLTRDNFFFRPTNAEYWFRNGVPLRIRQHATPALEKNRVNEVGIYAQDQWTIDRLTLNLGARFDSMNGYVPSQSFPGAPVSGTWPGVTFGNNWLPPVDFAPRSDVPAWRDFSPRLGAAYDLFGDGRTALKFSMGRYVGKSSTNMTAANNRSTRRFSLPTGPGTTPTATTCRTATWATSPATGSAARSTTRTSASRTRTPCGGIPMS